MSCCKAPLAPTPLGRGGRENHEGRGQSHECSETRQQLTGSNAASLPGSRISHHRAASAAQLALGLRGVGTGPGARAGGMLVQLEAPWLPSEPMQRDQCRLAWVTNFPHASGTGMLLASSVPPDADHFGSDK